MKMKIVNVQANSTVGDLEGNLKKIYEYMDQYSTVDLLVFPECFLTGYPLQDLVLRPHFLTEVEEALHKLASVVQERNGVSVLVGAPLTGTDLPMNGAVLLKADGTRQMTYKTELPNNDVFDERRVFAHHCNPKPLDFMGYKLGVMICEDMWHGRVARSLVDEGADVLIVMNGSPMEINKQDIRLEHARRRVHETGLSLLYLNLIGGQDELVFDGGSFLINDSGVLQAQLPFNEGCICMDIEKGSHSAYITDVSCYTEKGLSFVHQEYPTTFEAIYHTLVMGLSDYVKKNGFQQTLLGLSGGLDSALVATLAVDALGADRVLSLMLPAQWTGEESQNLALELAKNLGCSYKSIAVGGITEALEQTLNDAVKDLTFSDFNRNLASENIQARARGNILMAMSNTLPQALLLSTGNKSEMSVGYATLYGDMCGGFNPIKDVYKTLAFDLCRWRNLYHFPWMKGPVHPIPVRIIDRPPTAELAENQADENVLGSYEHLDAVLHGLIEEMLDPIATARLVSKKLKEPVSVEYTHKIAHLVQKAEYKRRQSPPGIKLTSKSFGFGWRYPITNKSSF